MTILRSSRELVRETRLQRLENARQFANWIGVKRQQVEQVEAGTTTFGPERVAEGCGHPNAELRAFWLDYWAVRQRETQRIMMETALTGCQTAGVSVR